MQYERTVGFSRDFSNRPDEAANDLSVSMSIFFPKTSSVRMIIEQRDLVTDRRPVPVYNQYESKRP